MPPFRRVVIQKDSASPLHFLRCATPCQADGWCMGRDIGQRMCWLGSDRTAEGAARLAQMVGYEIAEQPKP